MCQQIPWYALSVKHQHERPLEAGLRSKGFEAWAPTYRGVRRWSDRKKEIDLPLFPGYVFCRFEFSHRVRVLDTPGVSRIVGFGGRPVAVSSEEIESIEAALASKLPLRPWPYAKPGDRVRVEHGPLRGVEGTLLREKDVTRMVIGVELLQRAIAVEIDAHFVVPIPAPLGRAAAAAG